MDDVWGDPWAQHDDKQLQSEVVGPPASANGARSLDAAQNRDAWSAAEGVGLTIDWADDHAWGEEKDGEHLPDDTYRLERARSWSGDNTNGDTSIEASHGFNILEDSRRKIDGQCSGTTSPQSTDPRRASSHATSFQAAPLEHSLEPYAGSATPWRSLDHRDTWLQPIVSKEDVVESVASDRESSSPEQAIVPGPHEVKTLVDSAGAGKVSEEKAVSGFEPAPSTPFKPIDERTFSLLFSAVPRGGEAIQDFAADIISNTSSRKTWYRISRHETMHRFNGGGSDDTYTRVSWLKSATRRQALATVSRWATQDRVHGRVILGRKASSGFGWQPNGGPLPESMPDLHSFTSEVGLGQFAVSASKTTSPQALSPISPSIPTARFGWSTSVVPRENALQTTVNDAAEGFQPGLSANKMNEHGDSVKVLRNLPLSAQHLLRPQLASRTTDRTAHVAQHSKQVAEGLVIPPVSPYGRLDNIECNIPSGALDDFEWGELVEPSLAPAPIQDALPVSTRVLDAPFLELALSSSTSARELDLDDVPPVTGPPVAFEMAQKPVWTAISNILDILDPDLIDYDMAAAASPPVAALAGSKPVPTKTERADPEAGELHTGNQPETHIDSSMRQGLPVQNFLMDLPDFSYMLR